MQGSWRGLVILSLSAACAAGAGKNDSAVGDNGETGEALDPICADAPLVTWDNFGKAIMVESCQPCHASTSVNRQGAPEAVIFDTYEDVLTWKASILGRATGEDPTMPPAFPMSERDRYLLEVWLACWE